MGRNVEAASERGVAQAEYVALLALISVGMTVALGALGRLLVSYLDVIEGLCGLPFP